MDELKPGWKRVKFGELATCVNERVDDPSQAGVDRYVGLEHLDPESLTIRRWGTPHEVESTKLRFRPGDIIFGKRRAYQRKLAVADFDGICSAHAMVLRAKAGDVVVPEFLPFFMQSDVFMERAQAISVGSLSPTINWKTLAAEEFTLPALGEQLRLAGLLSAIAECREAIGLGLRDIRLVRRAFAKHVFDSSVNRRPLGELARFSSGKLIAVSALPKAREPGSEVPVFGGNGAVGFAATALAIVPVPAVVIGRVGEYCGAVYVVSEPSWVTDNALFAKEIDASLEPEYLALCLDGAQLNRLSVGGAQPLLTQSILARLSVPVPPKTAQQEAIGRRRLIDDAIQHLECRKSEISEYKARVQETFS